MGKGIEHELAFCVLSGEVLLQILATYKCENAENLMKGLLK